MAASTAAYSQGSGRSQNRTAAAQNRMWSAHSLTSDSMWKSILIIHNGDPVYHFPRGCRAVCHLVHGLSAAEAAEGKRNPALDPGIARRTRPRGRHLMDDGVAFSRSSAAYVRRF